MATTKAQRKLFFNLRSHKQGFESMTPDQIDQLAETLNVKREEVIEMETRLTGRDIALDAPVDDDEDKFAPIAYLSCDKTEPTKIIEAQHYDQLQTVGLETALDNLDPRSQPHY